MATTPAGWYPDPTPAQAGEMRYWDGQRWTQHTHRPTARPAQGARRPAGWLADPEATTPGQLRYWDGKAWTAHINNPSAPARPTPPPYVPQADKPTPPPYVPQADKPTPPPVTPPPPYQAKTAAPATPPVTPPPPYVPAGTKQPRKRRRGPIFATIAAITVVALAVTAGAFYLKLNSRTLAECSALTDMPVYDGEPSALVSSDIVCTDTARGLDFTAPADAWGADARDVKFEFQAKVNHDRYPEELEINASEAAQWGFRVFSDPGLSVELDLYISNEDDNLWLIDSRENPFLQAHYGSDDPRYVEFPGGVETVQLRDNVVAPDKATDDPEQESGWGLYERYFLVRYVDAQGEPLERPVVSEFGFDHEFSTPEVSYGLDPNSPGDLRLEWREVPGAHAYIVVKAYTMREEDGLKGWHRTYEIIGGTKETSWSISEDLTGGDDNKMWGDTAFFQNYSFTFWDPTGAGNLGAADGYEYGVIAATLNEDGSVNASAFSADDATEIAGRFAYQIRDEELAERFGVDADYIFSTGFDSLDEVPLAVPVTALDGSPVEYKATIVAATIKPADDVVGEPNWYTALYFAAGTQLGLDIWFHVDPDDDPLKVIEDFNWRADQQAGLTGDMWTTMSLFELTDATILSTAPDVDFPVFGSHPFVEYLAHHMVARTEAVDYSSWIGQPGLPDVIDAVLEAMDQNPYQYVQDFSVSGSIIYFTYAYGADAYRGHQDELHNAVAAAVASVIKDGMTDAQKATAINNYLVRQADYDYDALNVMDAWSWDSTGQTWREYAADHGVMHAWEANGAWSPGVFVCYGYSLAFHAMAMEIGLPAVTVTGPMDIGGSHAWNKVLVNGAWYGVDATWNDSEAGNQLLLVTDSQWGSSRAYGPNALRQQDSDWMLDANIVNYTTP